MRLSHNPNRFHSELLEQRRLLSFYGGGDYPVGNVGSRDVVAADLNGDGRMDLATANFGAGTVSVLLCNANGTFGAAQAFPANPNGILSTTSVAAGDFNGDGKIDLVTTNGDQGSGFPSLLLGNGDGTFYAGGGVYLEPPPVGQILYYHASDVAVADLNADGKPDLLFTGLVFSYDDGGQTYSFIAAALGQGNGAFTQSFGEAGLFLGNVVAADLNSDGKVDHITTREVRFGLGNGTFAAPQDIIPTDYRSEVTVADFNGDGKPDIATANPPSNGGHVLLNNGDGTFQPPRSYISGANPLRVASADFNGDGKTDLVTANGDNSLTVCLGNGNGTFRAPLSFPLSAYPPGMAVADFNLDGRPDLAVGVFTSSLINFRVLINDGIWATKTYVGPASGGSWSTAGNWSPGVVPALTDLVTIAGKSVNLSASATSASLSLTGGASLTLAPNGNRVLRTSTLFFEGNAKLNLNDNGLIVDYTGASPLTQVHDLIVSGRNGGFWNARGINSSSAAAIPGTGLGFGEATDLFNTFPTSFVGEEIDDTSVLVRYTLLGDANLDQAVNIADFAALATNFNVASTRWSRGDFNYDAVTNIGDFSILGSNFNMNIAAASSRSTTPMMTSRISRFSGLEINPDWEDLCGARRSQPDLRAWPLLDRQSAD